MSLFSSTANLFWRYPLRPGLFLMDPEQAHEFSMRWFDRGMKSRGLRAILRQMSPPADSRLAVERFGIRFPSPVGLAAGFDKHARWFNTLHELGFGSIEVGTLTPVGQPGNDKPRLFRLPADRALINRMGFNNHGAEAAAEFLAKTEIRPILGINIGKNKVTPNEQAPDDYRKCVELLFPYARYITVNVSSPNTQGLRDLQDPASLGRILEVVQTRNQELATEQNTPPRPVLVKIAPDLDSSQLKGIAELCLERKLSGIIATNTTISRANLKTPQQKLDAIGAGGLSGAPLTERSRQVVSELFRLTEGKLPIIGVGGIMNGGHAWDMLRAGASLIQVYTGFIYGGPMFIADLHRTLLKKLDQTGSPSLEAIIGSAV